MLSQLRFGRGVDNRKLKAAGAPLRHTTRETVQAFAEHLRVAAIRRDDGEPYRYEREVEEFLRYSPSVRRAASRRRVRADRQRNCRTSSGYRPVLPSLRQVRTRSFFIVATLVVLLLVAAGGVYAYDSGREDQIAKGITVGGVDVGGLEAHGRASSACAPRCSSRSTAGRRHATTASASR